MSGRDTLGVALAGLGKYATEELAPALTKTRLCKLTAIVTGDRAKSDQWCSRYGIPEENVYSYDTFDRIAENRDVDIVYVVLPNALHAGLTERAARAGKHVICEKPMATTVEDCRRMIAACNTAGVQLSIGYRLHFDPYNLFATLFRFTPFGRIKRITASHGLEIPAGVWRLNKSLAGGGPLMDVGIYCVQAAINVKGEVPIVVTAEKPPPTSDSRFKEVEQSLRWTMLFRDGCVAECDTSYVEEKDHLRVEAEDEWLELSPAYAYRELRAKAGKSRLDFPEINQQARQMDDFAACVMSGKKTRVSGEMGLRDVELLMAIYEASSSGREVDLQSWNTAKHSVM